MSVFTMSQDSQTLHECAVEITKQYGRNRDAMSERKNHIFKIVLFSINFHHIELHISQKGQMGTLRCYPSINKNEIRKDAIIAQQLQQFEFTYFRCMVIRQTYRFGT